MARFSGFAARWITIAAIVLCWPLSAMAGSITDTAAIIAFSQPPSSAYAGEGNPYVVPIRSGLDTNRLTLPPSAESSMVMLANDYTTLFAGSLVMTRQTAANADTYVRGPSALEYAIALGYQTQNSGIAAGFDDGLDGVQYSGDCGQWLFLAELSKLPMAEPCSAAVFAAGIFYVLVSKAESASFLKKRSKNLLRFGFAARASEPPYG
jgi:hypothetical protein